MRRVEVETLVRRMVEGEEGVGLRMEDIFIFM